MNFTGLSQGWQKGGTRLPSLGEWIAHQNPLIRTEARLKLIFNNPFHPEMYGAGKPPCAPVR